MSSNDDLTISIQTSSRSISRRPLVRGGYPPSVAIRACNKFLQNSQYCGHTSRSRRSI
jgi:hypothetical protein